jgi:hypothetical protein
LASGTSRHGQATAPTHGNVLMLLETSNRSNREASTEVLVLFMFI